MKLSGNLLEIKNSRESKNVKTTLEIDNIEYITHKKDGKYYQPFDFVEELETPLVLSGDCLSRAPGKGLEEGEFEFDVYDKDGETYVLNPDKKLFISMVYDFDADLQILTSVTYTVTISNEEFNRIKSEKAKLQKQKKGRKSR